MRQRSTHNNQIVSKKKLVAQLAAAIICFCQYLCRTRSMLNLFFPLLQENTVKSHGGAKKNQLDVFFLTCDLLSFIHVFIDDPLRGKISH